MIDETPFRLQGKIFAGGRNGYASEALNMFSETFVARPTKSGIAAKQKAKDSDCGVVFFRMSQAGTQGPSPGG